MPTLDTSFLLRWSCPPRRSTSPPQKTSDGHYEMMHVEDLAGNDFEIWCVRGALSHYYLYRISFPDGGVEVLSQCVYDLGINDVSLEYEGDMSEVTTDGRPVVNVGEILLVKHSNTEATGTWATGLKPKKGGADFHVLHYYKRRERYRVTTVDGKGTGIDELSSATDPSEAPYRAILRAEAATMHSRADFAAALAADTAFRRVDDPNAKGGTDHLRYQEPDPTSPPIGSVYLEEGERHGAVLQDQSMGGSSFWLHSSGVAGELPAARRRARATFAVQRSLFRNRGEHLTVVVDGRTLARPVLRPTSTMVVVDLAVDGAAHKVQVLEPGAATSTSRRKESR